MDISGQLRTAIIAQSLPAPSASFLIGLCTARNPPPPLSSLLSTAKVRLLACDLATSNIVDRENDTSLPALPAGVDNPQTREMKLQRDVHVQVLDIENLSMSRWEQVEELEAIDRGERTRGREVIRVVAEDDEVGGESQTQTARPVVTSTAAAGTNATHRLIVQDRSGRRIFAIELRRISGIGIGKTLIGEKMLLKAGTSVARGVVLLAPGSCVLLGGKIDAWHMAWTEGRLERLKASAGGGGD